MFYNARWYDPYLNRWTQPDTIVPDPSNPQALDRYAYTLNNPVRYTDPSGHGVDCGIGMDCLSEYVEPADHGNEGKVLDDNLWDWVPVVGDIRSIVRGTQMANNASAQPDLWAQQGALQGWYDSCYGECHYPDALTVSGNTTSGGPMPSTPLVDQYNAGMAEAVSGVVGLGQTVAIGSAMRGMPEPKLNTPRAGIRIAPFGNRNPAGPLASKLPHFHTRLGPDFGSSYYGLGWDSHHPWDDFTKLLKAIFRQ